MSIYKSFISVDQSAREHGLSHIEYTALENVGHTTLDHPLCPPEIISLWNDYQYIRLSWQWAGDDWQGKTQGGFIHLLSPDEIPSARGVIQDIEPVGDWHNVLPLIQLIDGSFIVIQEDKSVCYWSADAYPGEKGILLGSSFGEFLRAWASVGFAIVSDWRECYSPTGFDADASMFAHERSLFAQAVNDVYTQSHCRDADDC